jgi:hypothetical protein
LCQLSLTKLNKEASRSTSWPNASRHAKAGTLAISVLLPRDVSRFGNAKSPKCDTSVTVANNGAATGGFIILIGGKNPRRAADQQSARHALPLPRALRAGTHNFFYI